MALLWAIKSLSAWRRVHLRGGVDGRVARGTLGDAGAVVDDVFAAVRALAALLLPLACVVQILTEFEWDTAPALVGEVVFWAALHAGTFVLEAAAGHTVTGWVGLQAAAQALAVAALVVFGAGPMFALNRTHWGLEKEDEVRKSVLQVKRRWHELKKGQEKELIKNQTPTCSD